MVESEFNESEFYFAVGRILIKEAEARGEALSGPLKMDIMNLEARFNALLNSELAVRAVLKAERESGINNWVLDCIKDGVGHFHCACLPDGACGKSKVVEFPTYAARRNLGGVRG